jgi:hypothetical protein
MITSEQVREVLAVVGFLSVVAYLYKRLFKPTVDEDAPIRVKGGSAIGVFLRHFDWDTSNNGHHCEKNERWRCRLVVKGTSTEVNDGQAVKEVDITLKDTASDQEANVHLGHKQKGEVKVRPKQQFSVDSKDAKVLRHVSETSYVSHVRVKTSDGSVDFPDKKDSSYGPADKVEVHLTPVS